MVIGRYALIVACLSVCTACSNIPFFKPSNSPAKQPSTPAPVTQASQAKTDNKGGYYLDDGPGENAPDIASIPDATPKREPLIARANKPYTALGQQYIPMTNNSPYTKQGVASWYGRRYHGKKTSSGEPYDMYGMSAAHTTLPIPSYAKVTNPANGKSVIVRINDRGPFKHDRLIDLSYAAAYKLDLIKQGSGLVEVQSIDANTYTASPPAASVETQALPATPAPVPSSAPEASPSTSNTASGYYVQVGAFKSEANGEALKNKILELPLAKNSTVSKVYNDNLYRVKIGPFSTREAASSAANEVQTQLNLSTIITNQ